MILKFKPIYKERIWGGQNLKSKLNKHDLPQKNIGESWEISAHKEGESIVEDGIYKGKTLNRLYQELGHKYFGLNTLKYKEFPLLVKFLDAQDDLSVQVHPDDEYAKIHENSMGKEEIWYILDAEPESKLVYGIKQGISRPEFEKAIRDDNITHTLNYVQVKKGDVFFIPAGTLHAIGKGIQIVEIQQSSDITYRVFDYNRKDKNGNKRDLHVQKSLDVINFDFKTQSSINKQITKYPHYCLVNYAKCPNFSMDLIIFDTKNTLEYELKNNSFEIFICIEGSIDISPIPDQKTDTKLCQNYKLDRGDSIILTVEQKYNIRGKGKIILSYI